MPKGFNTDYIDRVREIIVDINLSKILKPYQNKRDYLIQVSRSTKGLNIFEKEIIIIKTLLYKFIYLLLF